MTKTILVRFLRHGVLLMLSMHWLCLSGQVAQELEWRTLDLRDGVPQSAIHSVMLHDRMGRLWFGSDRGLAVYDGITCRTIPVDPKDPSALPEINVQSLYEDSEGKIWVGMRNAGLAILDPVTNSFERIMTTEYGGTLPVTYLWNFLEIDGQMWFGSDHGLAVCDMKTRAVTAVPNDIPASTKAMERDLSIVRALIQKPGRPDQLYIGGGAGLFEFDIPTRHFTHLKMPYSSRRELDWQSDYFLVIDLSIADSVIWCSTWAGGLMSYDLRTQRWDRFHMAVRDITYDIGYRVVPRTPSELWCANNAALAVFHPGPDTFTYFAYDRQVPGTIMNGSIHDLLWLADSTLVVSGDRGISICVNSPWYTPEKSRFRPYLTAIESGTNLIESDSSLAFTQNVSLPSEDNDLTFSVVYPDFVQPENVRYRFRLEGHDAGWIETGNHIAAYQNLGGGNYTFRYQSSLDGKVWVDGLTAPHIHIRFVLWRHPLFYPGLAVLLFCIGLLIHRIRIRQIKKRQRIVAGFHQKLAEMEMSVLRAQMNPHFMFNSLNSIKNYILKERTDEASIYLTKFSQLMRAVLQNSRSTIIPLHDELRALSLYIELEALRFEDEFIWTLETDPALHPESLGVPPLLIQPYVENAIRHGLLEKEDGSRVLAVRIEPDGQQTIKIVIEDNGIGRAQSEKRQREVRRNRSYGMRITRDRIALIRKTLNISAEVSVDDLHNADGTAAGTRVVIRIPMLTHGKSEHFTTEAENTHDSYVENDTH